MKKMVLIISLFIAVLTAIPAFAEEEELLWTNFNTGAVQSGPKLYSGAPMKKDTEPVLITKVRTYHWNDGYGAPAGTISICEDELANVIGTWQAVGRSGSGRQNVYWEALVDCVMYPGHNYFVKVSDKASWSYNAESEGGFYELYGIFPAPEGSVDPARYPNSAADTLRVGQTFTMGRYEQDNNLRTGVEPIEWQVLTLQSDRALVISKYALETITHSEMQQSTSWEGSSYRKWLNDEFYNTSFNENEKNKILQVTNENPDNPEYGTDGGNRTQDRIFLLSLDEAKSYFTSDEARKCEITEYVKGTFITTGGIYSYYYRRPDDYGAMWMLRTPGSRENMRVLVNMIGSIELSGSPCDAMLGCDKTLFTLRPAFWIKTSSAAQPAATPKPRTCYKVTYAGNNCLAKVPTDNKCYQLGDLVTVLFEPVEYMQSLIFNGWDMDGDNVADFGYYYPTFAMPNRDVELKAVCYQQYQDHGYSQYGITTGEVDPDYYDPQQYYNPYHDPTLNNDIYDPNTGWWYDPGDYYGYDGVG